MLAPAGFISTAIMVLQALTLVVQTAMTVVVVIFRDQNTRSWAEGKTPRLAEPKDLGHSENNQRWVPRSSVRRGIRSWPLRYALAPSFVAVALVASLLVRRTLHISLPLAWYMAAVVITVWYGGLGPGVLASTLSVLAIGCILLPWQAATPSRLTYLVLFVLWALVSSWFILKRRGAEEPLKQVVGDWKRRWEGASVLIETNAQLQQEITKLRERIVKLEEAVRRGAA